MEEVIDADYVFVMDDGRFQGPPTFQIFLLRQRIMRFQLFPGILFRGPHDIPVVRCIFRIARFASCDCAEESDGDALFRHAHQSHVRIVRGNRLQSSRNIACGRALLALQQVFQILQ